jgi:predicted PurR-regulated permease PerM
VIGPHSSASTDPTDILLSIKRLLLGILLLLLAAALYFGKLISMPIVLGLLIAFTLSPVTRWLKRFGMPYAIAGPLVIIIVAGSIGTGGYLLSDTLSSTLDRVPQIIANLKAKLVTLKSSVDFLSQMRSDVESLTGEVGSAEVAIAQPGILSAAASSAASGLTAFALAALFALILLSSGTLVDEKLVSSAPLLEDKKKTVRILRDVENQVSRYLLTITLINVSLGLVIGTLLSLHGTQNAILWGAIAAVLNFLPYIGAIVGAGFLAIVSLGEQTSIAAALIPPLIYYACSAIEGNLITPLIVGRNLSLNVIAVFVSIVVWSWLWGFAGALMAVPILVVIKVVSDHVDSWKSLGHFLSARD